METVLVISPHADDESLGCGGTLAKHANNKDSLFWVNVTSPSVDSIFDEIYISKREDAIQNIKFLYNISEIFSLDYRPSSLSSSDLPNLVKDFSEIFKKVKPSIIYAPFWGDAHSDHQIVYNASKSLIKPFRYSSIRSFRIYETLSETNFALNDQFRPNLYINISDTLEAKLKAIEFYDYEMQPLPFPRNRELIESLAKLRGSESGFNAAEAFMLLKQYET